jgi:hypothetical protein
MADGEIVLLDVSVSKDLTGFLDALPWEISSIDWEKFQYSQKINLTEYTNEDLLCAVRKTAFGAHEHAIALFSAEEPCLAGSFKVIFENLDVIFWKVPGPRFVFASDIFHEVYIPKKEVFLRYDGGDEVIFSR